MVKKILRYTCDRCNFVQNFEENYPVSCSPKACGWRDVEINNAVKNLCPNCNKELSVIIDKFLSFDIV